MCPLPLMKKLQAPLILQASCTEDSHCVGAEKCCETGCGRMCRVPLEGDYAAGFEKGQDLAMSWVGAMIKHCEVQGPLGTTSFARKVSSDQPIRGHLHCPKLRRGPGQSLKNGGGVAFQLKKGQLTPLSRGEADTASDFVSSINSHTHFY